MSLDRYLSRVTPKHADRPKFIASLTAILQPLVDVQSFLEEMRLAFDLDQAIGVQLDAVGVRVGRSRNIPIPIPGLYFAFDDAALGFDIAIWKGPFDEEYGVTRLDDETYRRLLRAKILANNWDGTTSGGQAAFDSFFQDPRTHVFLEDKNDMRLIIAIAGKIPSRINRAILAQRLIPIKPEGVEVDVLLTSVDNSPLFGFDVENEYVSGFDVGAWGIKLLMDS